MTNRMIHDPAHLSSATIAEYWQSVTSVNVTGGYYVANSTVTDSALVVTFDSQTGWTVGWKGKYSGSSATFATVLTFRDSAVTHTTLDFQASTGVFRVTRNGTVLLTSSTPLAASTDYYIEFQTLINDATGVAILKVDGVTDSVINSSALDTRNAGNASANQLEFSMTKTNTGAWSIREMYVNDNAGGVDDTFWGPVAVVTLRPSTAGNKAQWTPSASTNVSNVDDTAPDGDSTYNATSTNGQIDSFTATDTGYSAGTVKGAEWAAEGRRVDASSTARVAPVYRIGGTDYVGSDIALQTSYRIQTQRARVSPATGVAWTVAELDAMEIGYKRSAA